MNKIVNLFTIESMNESKVRYMHVLRVGSCQSTSTFLFTICTKKTSFLMTTFKRSNNKPSKKKVFPLCWNSLESAWHITWTCDRYIIEITCYGFSFSSTKMLIHPFGKYIFGTFLFALCYTYTLSIVAHFMWHNTIYFLLHVLCAPIFHTKKFSLSNDLMQF